MKNIDFLLNKLRYVTNTKTDKELLFVKSFKDLFGQFNSVDISNIQAKKEKIQKEDFLSSITSNEFTKYDGLDVKGLNVNHLSASQLGSYAKCPDRKSVV